MAAFKVTPGPLSGKIVAPPSKSQTLRAILFGSMGEGVSRIHRYLKSPDTLAMVEALRLFGVEIQIEENQIEIQGCAGKLKAAANVIDAGNSGQVLRFIAALAALLPTYTIITGDHSIRHQRPVAPLLSALTQLKSFATSATLDGRAPIIVQGPLQVGRATLPGEDSQPVSALLIATSFLQGSSQLTVTHPGEKPWIDLTLSWLKRLGALISHENYEHYQIAGSLRYKGFEFSVPGDFSSAAFPLIAALITQSQIQVENLDLLDNQGDKKIIPLLQEMGAVLEIDHEGLNVLGGNLRGRVIDVNDMIDALPILSVLGCFAKGRTELVNGAIARKKESDRILVMAEELRKMGGQIEEREDGLIITASPLKGAVVQAHNDHRIAMALTVAALAAKGPSTILGSECVAKSYPDFVADFKKMGGQIEVVE